MKTLYLILVLTLSSGFSELSAQDNSRDGGIKAYEKIVAGEFVIFISNVDGSNERELTLGIDPHLSLDQTRVAFVRRGDLYVINIATNDEQMLLDNREYWEIDPASEGLSVRQPFWSPDGKVIFFDFVSTSILIHLYAINADGTNPQKITRNGSLSASSWPSPFSPDNRKVLINTCFDQCATLFVFDLEQSTHIQLSDRSERGAWSPDGQRIAFGDVYDRRLNIINVDGTGQTELLEKIGDLMGLDFRVGTITWSSNGQRLAFTAHGLSNGEDEKIYEVHLDGTEFQQRETHFSSPPASPPTGVKSTTWGQVKEEAYILSRGIF